MSNETLTIVSGLPFGKEINISLPTGRTWWTQLSNFEVLFQIREDKMRDSPLVKDMSEYLTVSMPESDTIKVEIFMTGAETRDLEQGGFYDILVSDTGTTDARAYRVLKGTVKRQTVITAETAGEP